MFAVKGFEMQKMDQYMIKDVGVPSCVLMENAAKAVVDSICAWYPKEKYSQQTILIVCGTGNNGADGVAIGRWLLHLGYCVQFIFIGNQENVSKDFALQKKILEPIREMCPECKKIYVDEHSLERHQETIEKWLSTSVLVVDSMLGTGCNRRVSNVFHVMIEWINQFAQSILAVDVPSGINSDNGKIMGNAIRANRTLTFSMPKLGTLLFPGAEHTGELCVKDIGIYTRAEIAIQQKIEVLDYEALQKAVGQGVFRRKKNSHKGMFGCVGIIAGDEQMLGATLLAIQAAYRCGAGLVKVFAHSKACSLFLGKIPECVLCEYTLEENLEEKLDVFRQQVDVVVAGPGLSQSEHAKKLIYHLLNSDGKVVFDADALNIIAQHMNWFEDRCCECIITPHIGEMSRLTGYCSSGIIENPIHFATAMNEQYHVTTVLKSARTIIASKMEHIYLSVLGNPGMATAGSGDVLAGVIGGFIAQGYSLEDSAKYGVMLHGYAGDYYAEKKNIHSLMATDLIECLWKGVEYENNGSSSICNS